MRPGLLPQINPRTSTALFVKSGLILATLALSYYGAFFAFSSGTVRVADNVPKCIGAGAPQCEPLDPAQSFSGSGHVVLGRTELSADKLHACLQATLISAAILGVAMAEVGVSIQHDANHGAFSTNDCVGAALVSPSAAT